ncbi:MAG TPA: DUF1800 domain-containing protein [Candidatus Limnocylindria bacterium]|nr:DUF1800 domain-containing protein [Candidatus Limnocylindria bacterium]
MTANLSRRSVLGAAAVGTAAVAASTALATPASAAPVVAPLQAVGVAPAAPRLLGSDSTLHLLRRATYGLTPSLVARGRSLGARAWLEEQLAPSTITDTTADAMLTHFPRLKWSIKTVWDAENRPDTDPLRLDNFSWDVMMDLLHSTVGRALWSKRQLFEVMVDFWSNHLNVTCPGDGWDNRHLYDRDVIRKYTFGSYKDMLLASAKHPAMLQYLNQAESNKYAPNENYARELLELHSVGVDGGYEEADIYAAARLLTGLTTWNPNPPYSDTNPSWTRQDFTFNASMHDATAGKVLGYSWAGHNAGQGLTSIDAYITYLAKHRKTAERIAYKLGQRFVADEPPASLVSRLADVYQANNTAIVPVLRALFTSREFRYSSGMKVRRPYEDLIAGLRAIDVRPSTKPDFPADGVSYFRGLEAVYYQSRDLGNAPLNWGPPNGYPDTARDWQSANGMLGRWNNHRSHAEGWWPSRSDNGFTWPDPVGTQICRSMLPTTLPATHGEYVDVLARRLLQQNMRPEHRSAVLTFLGKAAGDPLKSTDAAVNWKLGSVVALILNSPYHALR